MAEPRAPGPPGGDLRVYRRLLVQARDHWPHIGGLFALGLLAAPLALLAPLPLKIAVDNVIGDEPVPGWLGVLPDGMTDSKGGLLAVVTALVVLIALASQLTTFAKDVLETSTGERLVLGFRTALFGHVQRLSLTYHDRRGVTDSLYRIQYDAPAIQWIAVNGVTPFVSSGLMVAGMIAVTASIDWQLALVALAVAPVLVALTIAFRRRLRAGWARERTLDSSAMAVVQEALSGLRVVKAFGQEDREHVRYVERSRASTSARIRLAVAEGLFGLLTALTVAVGTAAALYIGVSHVQDGVITLGSLLVVMAYLVQLYQPMSTIAHSVTTLQESLASAERALFVLDQEPDVADPRYPRPARRAEGAITFEGVTFGYDPARPVLHDISFAIPPGTRLGIAGRTGSGKTTLVGLMMRFHDPGAGRVLLDGRDIRDLRVADLRSQFAVVLQEPVLFSTTIAENIAYGRPGARLDEIAAAARAAGVHDVVEALPDGYDTLVGERGMTLSGGERQRISLARAFLTDAPILILDEPTSAVDVATEAMMIDAMERLMEGRTVVMIAHRLSTLARCDAYLQLAEGRVVSTDAPAGVRGSRAAARSRR
ncbi:ABC transporter ATP-binding protein [Miltoncostaea marina]|uniref:ABC transporter ATP-binding protein n=1 Tax=Miltoncostaea marina TaxID=2843215 RepID=UPI001C3C58F9|nr:ABC transporter ATP-binding protein [Miltoncostaea marina]